MSNLLEVRNLKTYFYTQKGIVKAVNDISYDLAKGEILGIVGESGCGKSVSALSIMRLIPSPPGRIVEGSIVFEGQDLLKSSERDMRNIRGNRIAMVFQEPMTSLNPVLTIGRQLTETLELHCDMTKPEADAQAIELLRIVGMSDPSARLNDYPHQYSGGMRQRVMVAMALSCKPKLIIADEPTTALDVTIQAQILELMSELSQQFGTALIIVTHNLGVIARYAHRVLVMYAGRIIEAGNSTDIFQNPRHPYTKGLLDSIPRLDGVGGSRLKSIDGQPPDLINLPTGCSFAPRCSYAYDRCFTEDPVTHRVNDTHISFCWRSLDIVDA